MHKESSTNDSIAFILFVTTVVLTYWSICLTLIDLLVDS